MARHVRCTNVSPGWERCAVGAEHEMVREVRSALGFFFSLPVRLGLAGLEPIRTCSILSEVVTAMVSDVCFFVR